MFGFFYKFNNIFLPESFLPESEVLVVVLRLTSRGSLRKTMKGQIVFVIYNFDNFPMKP